MNFELSYAVEDLLNSTVAFSCMYKKNERLSLKDNLILKMCIYKKNTQMSQQGWYRNL